MTVSVKIEGLAEMEAALAELGSPSTARRVGQRALIAAAAPMVQTIQALAPKDRMNLERSIKAQPSSFGRRDGRASVVIGIDSSVKPTVSRPTKSGTGTAIDLGVGGYSVMQEFGTVNMAANPYMRPGFDAEAEATIRRVGDTLGPEIEKSAARLAKRRAKAAAAGS